MARKIKISRIYPSDSALATFEIDGDFTQVFQGRFYLSEAGERAAIHTSATPPVGFETVVATTFSVVGNAKYSGTYTVHTPIDATPAEASSVFSNGKTQIRVNEDLNASAVDSDLTAGYITNISTYLLRVNDRNIVIPPRQPFENEFDVKLYGKDTLNWGEGYAQNFASLTSNFASITSPPNPEDGQLWFDVNIKKIKIWYDEAWHLLGGSGGGNSSQFKFTQVEPASSWVIDHALDIAEPFIAITQVFVDRGAGAQQIMPSKITYDNANRMTITFSKAEKGWALIQV